jgi:HEAT repeat protein
VRFAAVEYLARFGGAQERAVIRERLNDAHVAVRTAAQTALGEI